MKTREILVAIGVLAGAASAVAQSTTGHDMSGYAKDAMAMHEQMMAKMQMEPSDNPDKDFVMMMIPHHQGAIDMARLELQYGKDPELRALAEKIISDQEKEISQMKAWQTKAQ